jgi:DNA-binding transcriptional regulator YbjK
MPAHFAYIVGMKNNHIQYTLRKVPQQVDQALRQRAQAEKRSLNEITIEVIEHGLGLTGKPVRHHDLDDLIGTWVHDSKFDQAVEEMDQIDTELWK